MDTIAINLGTVFVSFVIYQLIFHFVSSWFSAKVSPRFKDLSLEKKIKWNSRALHQAVIPGSPSRGLQSGAFFLSLIPKVGSTCQALVAGVFSLYILLFHEAATADPLWDDPWLVNVNIAIDLGYVISGFLLLFFYWRAIGGIEVLIRRCTVIYIYILVLKEGALAYIANFRLILHLSILFYNQRWFLKTLGYSKSSEAYVINEVFATAMFFLRIAVIPPFYYCIYRMYGTDAFISLGLLIQCSWIGSIIVFDIIHVIRMIRILREWVRLSQDTLSHQTRESNQKSSS